MNFQRKDAKTQRREQGRLLLTPGFSQVSDAGETEKPFQRFLRAGGKPLKRFARHADSNTRLKPGAHERVRRDTKMRSEIWNTIALTPALSPRRGRNVRRFPEYCEAVMVRSASEKTEFAKRCSLSPGERVRVRASQSETAKVLTIWIALLISIGTYAQGSLTLNPGDSYAYEFSTLPFDGPWDVQVPPGVPLGRIDGSFIFQVGSSVLVEMFETSPASQPIASQTLSYPPGFPAPPGPWFWSADAWQDLQGAVRVSALTGSVTMHSLHVRAIRNDSGILNSYGSSALPVPEPSSFLLLGLSGVLCVVGASKSRHNVRSNK